MYVDEEMKLLKEIVEIHRFLIDHVSIDLQYGGHNEAITITREAEGNQNKAFRNF